MNRTSQTNSEKQLGSFDSQTILNNNKNIIFRNIDDIAPLELIYIPKQENIIGQPAHQNHQGKERQEEEINQNKSIQHLELKRQKIKRYKKKYLGPIIRNNQSKKQQNDKKVISYVGGDDAPPLIVTFDGARTDDQHQPTPTQNHQYSEQHQNSQTGFYFRRYQPEYLGDNQIIEQVNFDQIQNEQKLQQNISGKNQNRLQNNYIGAQSIPSQAVIQPIDLQPYKLGILLSIIMIFLGVSGMIGYFIFTKSQTDNIEGSKQNIINLSNQQNFINRTFEANKIYYQSYLITTEMNSSQIQVNYTLIYVVKQRKGDGIHFLALIQKRWERLYDQKGIFIKQILYDQSNLYMKLLKQGKDSVAIPIDPNKNRSKPLVQMDFIPTENSTYIRKQPIIQIFRFYIQSNGKIKTFTFPTKMDKNVLGLIRSFTKLFSPILTVDLYKNKRSNSEGNIEQNDEKKEKKIKLQQTNYQNLNKTEEIKKNVSKNTGNNSSYKQAKKYNFQTDDTSIYLQNQGSIASSDITHNTKDNTTQQNAFSFDGELTKATMKANTQFMTPEYQAQENCSVVNLNLYQKVAQKVQMILIYTFMGNKEYIEQFQTLIIYYEQKNQTYTFTISQIIDYILGKTKEQNFSGEKRVLLEDDGSLSIFNYGKRVEIVKTNIIGLNIEALGYAEIKLNLYQDQNDQNKKIPKIQAGIGTYIIFGFLRFKDPILQYNKQLPPLTLKFTLEKIQGVINLLKSDFIGKIISLTKSILNGDFQKNLVPNILRVLEMVTEVDKAVRAQERANSPVSIIVKVLTAVSNIRAIVESKGLQLLNPQNQLGQKIIEQIMSYFNVSYVQSLAVFNSVKGNLSAIREGGINYLKQIALNFTLTEIKQIQKQIRNLIPGDVWQEYQKQIQKAKSIIEFLRFVKDETIKYSSFIESTLVEHRNNYIFLVKKIVDLYFRNQTIITSKITDLINNRFNVIREDLAKFKHIKQAINITQLNNRVNHLFQGLLLLDFHASLMNREWDRRISELDSVANGISAEKGDCCQWGWKRFFRFKTRKYCKWTNAAIQDQAAEPQYFKSLKTMGNSYYKQMSNRIKSSYDKIKTVVNNKNIGLVDKFIQIKAYNQQFRHVLTEDMMYNFLSKIKQRIEKAKDIRSRIGCGGTSNIDSYIPKLQSLHIYAEDLFKKYKQLNFSAYSIINQFNQTVYTTIIQNSMLLQSIQQFFNRYKSSEEITKQFFKKLTFIVQNYDPSSFASSDNIALQVFTLYGNVTDSLKQLCINKQSHKASIDTFRRHYQIKSNNISGLNNAFLSYQIKRVKQFLNYGGANLYESFLKTNFCQAKDRFEKQIQILFPDFQNFTLIFSLYKRLEKVISEVKGKIYSIKEEVQMLPKRFFKQFKPEGFKNLIYSGESLTKNFERMTDSIRLQLVQIRKQAKILSSFQMATSKQIANCIQFFTNTSFVMNSLQLFRNIGGMVQNSITTVQILSYDVLAFVVASKDILQYFEDSLQNFKSGSKKVMQIFGSLCGKFIDLNAMVKQDYLISINNNFKQLVNNLNSTIFPNITQKIQQIRQKYKDYKFSSIKLKNLFNNSMLKLQQYSIIISSTKQNLFRQINKYFKKILELLDKLQIGSLNSIFQLAQVIKIEFRSFLASFPEIVKQLLSFKDIINKDFRKIFNFKQFYRQIQNKVQLKYQQSISKIQNKINQTQYELSQNSKFYKKFKNSTINKNLLQIRQKLGIKFSVLWQSASLQISKIQSYLKQLSQNTTNMLKELNEAKENMQQIQKNVTKRINNITVLYQQIKKKMTSIKSLFFMSLKQELNKTVAQLLHKIGCQVDNIIYLDLDAINKLASSTLKNRTLFLGQLISKVQAGYGYLVQMRKLFFNGISSSLASIENFINDQLVNKFQKLKQGVLYIKSQVDQETPVPEITLYQKPLYSKRVPLYNMVQIIPTPIGSFSITIQINYTLGIKVSIVLRQFRNIDLKVTFEASLNLQINFSYGIALVLQFGLYFKGNVLRGALSPAFQFNGIIPIQLVNAIKQVEQITKQNKGSIKFVIDLQIYALQAEVGFMLKHIWLQIIWIDFQLCFSALFFSFCISFRLPIGFKIVFKAHYWGKVFTGSPILKKRILDATLKQFSF